MRLLADENLDLSGLPATTKAELLIHLLKEHRLELPGSFSVLSPGMVRIRKRDLPDAF
jgi:hypothetical protein